MLVKCHLKVSVIQLIIHYFFVVSDLKKNSLDFYFIVNYSYLDFIYKLGLFRCSEWVLAHVVARVFIVVSRFLIGLS